MLNRIIASPNTLNSAFELWFVQNTILGGTPITLDYNPENFQNEVIVYLGYDIQSSMVDLLVNNNNQLIIYHLGDEKGYKDRSGYEKAGLVLRSYYFDHIINDRDPKVNWVPSGYKSGLGPRDPLHLKTTNQRPFPASFCGWISNPDSFNNERADFIGAAKRCGSNIFIKEASQFGGGFDIGLYATILENSLFCPCPAGNSPETIRLYDVLESGAIPIMLDHPFLRIANPYQAPPFPIIQSWEELPDFLSNATELTRRNPRHFSEMQRATLCWWSSIKERSRNLVLGYASRA